MRDFSYTVWLAKMVGEALWALSPISAALLAHILVAAYATVKNARPEAKFWWLVVPVLLSAMILLTGSIFVDGRSAGSSDLPSAIIPLLLGSQFVVAVYAVYKNSGVRWFAASLLLFELWVGLVCGFVASMSVTGKWL